MAGEFEGVGIDLDGERSAQLAEQLDDVRGLLDDALADTVDDLEEGRLGLVTVANLDNVLGQFRTVQVDIKQLFREAYEREQGDPPGESDE